MSDNTIKNPSRSRFVVLICSFVVLTVFSSFQTTLQATEVSKDIASLIETLGDTNYLTRQEAEAELKELGKKSLPKLREASLVSDLEIQTRSKRLVLEIEVAIYESNLKDFEDGKTSSIAHWDEYKKLVGASDADRKFFVQLHKAEPGLMRISPKEIKWMSDAFQARMDQIYFEYRTPSKNALGLQRRNLKELNDGNCALLFLSTYKDNQFIGHSTRTFSYICSTLNSKTNLASLLEEPAKLKLYNYWLQNGEMTSIRERLYSAKKLNDKETILFLASKAIEIKNPKSLVMDALTQIAIIREWKAIPDFQKLLDDTSDVSYYPSNRNRGITLQLKDAALLGLLIVTSQNPKVEYKFESPSSSKYTGKYVGFKDEKTRQAAHQKWDKWWEANKSNYRFEDVDS